MGINTHRVSAICSQQIKLSVASVLNRLIPTRCLLCFGNEQRNISLCRQCELILPKILNACGCCGQPLAVEDSCQTLCSQCILHPPPFRQCVAPYEYSYPVNHLITAFKFSGDLAAGRVLSVLLAQELQKRYLQKPKPDVLIPVPLHPKRLRYRGYNQAVEIARIISRQLHIPIATNLIHKESETDPQSKLGLSQRLNNVRGSFVLNQKALHILQGNQKRKFKAAIVDDVVTSQSTVSAVANLLGEEYCEWIEVWALARARIDT